MCHFSLSYDQDSYQMGPKKFPNNMLSAIKISGDLSFAALGKALNQLIGRYEVLWTIYRALGGGPEVATMQKVEIKFDVRDLSALKEDEKEIETQRLLTGWVQHVFDLTDEPLLKVQVLKSAMGIMRCGNGSGCRGMN